MKYLKLRDGTLQELLSLSLDYSDRREMFPFRVVARGQSWRDSHGYHHVPYLDKWLYGLCLDMLWYGTCWTWDDYFLAFRES